MQVEGGSGESSLQEKSAQPAVLVPSVNGMNILSGGRQFIISGNQGLLLDDSMKNGLHLVQKPVVVSAGIPNSPNLPLSSSQQLQTVPVVSVSSSAPSLNSRKLLPFSATSMESLQVGQSITILSKSKENVSSENTCSEMESITAADVDRCRVDNANFIPGNLSSRSAFVPVSNQKLTITLATPSIGHTPQTSDSSGDEAPLPMDQSDIVGHSGGFEPHALDSRPVERPSNATTVSFSEASLSVQPHTTLSASSLQSTQKKVKNRFTPIRPKAPQTVTTFQKDQKTPEKDSRPVSALLKEKRAREAQEILAHIASSVQGQANSSKGFPASLSLPAEVLGISSDKASGQNDVVIFLTSPSTGSANFLASSREVHISGEEKAIHEHDKSGVVTINMSDFQIANPNFIHSKDTQQTTLGQCHATEHALHMASQQVHDMPAISIFPAELQAVCGSQEIPSGKIRVDSGCVDASDSSEMGNTTDEEVTLHMDSGNATSIGLVSDNRGRDTPCRKRKSSGQESASQTNKRLNSSSKKNDAMEDDDVFIVEPSVSIQPHLGVGIVCEEDGGKQLLNRNIASILSRRVGLTSPIRCLQTSPVVMQVQTEESALMCRSTGIGTDDVTYSSVALLASSEFPGQVGTKLSVESLESDALLDSGLLPTGRELVSSSTSQQPAVHIGQKASVGISTKKLRAAQQDLLQQKPQLDARVSSYFSKGCGSQLTAQTIGQVSNFLFSSVTDSTTTNTTAGQDELTSVSRAGPGLLETMFRHSSDFLSLKNISSSTSIKIPDQISLPEVQQTRSVQSISMHGDAFNEDFQGNSSQLFEAGLIGNQEHASGKKVKVISSAQECRTTQTSVSSVTSTMHDRQQVASLAPVTVKSSPSPLTVTNSNISNPRMQSFVPKTTVLDTIKASPAQPINLLALLKSPALSAVNKPVSGSRLALSNKKDLPSTSRSSTLPPAMQTVTQKQVKSEPVDVIESDQFLSPSTPQEENESVTAQLNSQFLSGGLLIQMEGPSLGSNVFGKMVLPSDVGFREEMTSSVVDQLVGFLEPASQLREESSVTSSEQEGELPADVAEFVAEAMTAQELKLQHQSGVAGAGYLQSFLYSQDPFLASPRSSAHAENSVRADGSSISDLNPAGTGPRDNFTIPSNPAPKQRLSESSSAASKKYPPVQRSASLPVFVPPALSTGSSSACLAHDVPSPPSPCPANPRVSTPMLASSSSSGVIPAKRQRQMTSGERGGSQTSSDAGYHSYDSPKSASIHPATPVQDHTVAPAHKRSGPDIQSVPQGSPMAPNRLSSASTSSSAAGCSPVDQSIGSPNAFMPIQGSALITRLGSLGQPQHYIEPIRPVVTVATAAPSGHSTESCSITISTSRHGSRRNRTVVAPGPEENIEMAVLSSYHVTSTPSTSDVSGDTGPLSVRSVSSDPGVSGDGQTAARMVCISPRPGTTPYSAPSPATPQAGNAPGISPGPSPTPPHTSSTCTTASAAATSRSSSHGVLQKLLSTRGVPSSYPESVQQRLLASAQLAGSQIVGGSSDQKGQSAAAGQSSAGSVIEQHAGQFMVPLVSAEDIKPSARSVVHYIPATGGVGGTSERTSRRIAILKRDSSKSSAKASVSAPKATAETVLKGSNTGSSESSTTPEAPLEYPFSYKLALLRQQSMAQPPKDLPPAPTGTTSRTGSTGSRSNNKPQASASATLAASLANLQKQVPVPNSPSQDIKSAGSLSSVSESQQTKRSTGMSNLAVQVSSPHTPIPASATTPPIPHQQQINVPLRLSMSTQSTGDVFFGVPVPSPSQRLNPFSPPQPSPSSSSSTPPSSASSSSSLTTSTNSLGALYLPFNLPDMNYMGNAPNIDLSQLMPNKTPAANILVPPQPSASSSLNIAGFEDELQSTLDILRNIDGHYFNQEVEADVVENENTMMIIQSVFGDLSQEHDAQTGGDEEDMEQDNKGESRLKET